MGPVARLASAAMLWRAGVSPLVIRGRRSRSPALHEKTNDPHQHKTPNPVSCRGAVRAFACEGRAHTRVRPGSDVSPVAPLSGSSATDAVAATKGPSPPLGAVSDRHATAWHRPHKIVADAAASGSAMGVFHHPRSYRPAGRVVGRRRFRHLFACPASCDACVLPPPP